MRYGFTKDGCFTVVDDERRIGSFAFATSPHAEAAKRDPVKTALKMLAEDWPACPDNIREQHYLMSFEALAGAESAENER